jgi:peptide chain release factor 2
VEQLNKQLDGLNSEIASALARLNIAKQQEELNRLREHMERPDFWADNQKAQQVSKEEASLARKIQPWLALKKSAEELQELAGLNDNSIEADLKRQLADLEEKFEAFKKELRFQGTYDDHDVILSIYAGAGGTDAQDWAQMLERMYLRWAERQGLKAKIVDESPGEEAGIKSATVELAGGSYLYGKLAGEHGVHRLVRRSPFNSAASRETSFAKVDVLPLIDQPDEVDIDEKDLKIDVFRAGGHGGQSVNTTDSAVRVTHLPTGITVSIQNERSQLQNKETALAIMRSRLAQLQLEQHAETLADIKGPSQSNEFGSQIRNYILDDRILKDLRTGYENHDPQKVLDGQLDPLIDAWLQTPKH